MVQTVRLDENKHAVATLRGLLKQLQQEREHCDFIIKAQGQEYHAHKIVLSLGSPYFKAMLKHDMKEIQAGIVEMQDVDFSCVKSCIDSMYTATFVIPDGKIGDLLHAAIMMQLDDVKEAICEILKKSLNVQNFYETRKIAEIYNLQIIAKECRKFYEANFLEISHQAGFKDEEKSHLVRILGREKWSQEQKLSFSLRWVGENMERKGDIIELLKLIKLDEVSSKYLSNILENHPVVSNNLPLFKLVNAPLIARATKEVTRSDDATHIVLFDRLDNALNSYNPVTNEVKKYRNLKTDHLSSFSVVRMDTFIYLLGKDKSVRRFDFQDKTSKWERVQDMIADHGFNPPSVSLSGSLFVIAGNWPPTKVIEKFDVAANQWLILRDKPVAVSNIAIVSVNDSIYCIGGYSKNGILKSHCRFDPTDHWINLAPMSIARAGCIAAVCDQKIFVMGGEGISARGHKKIVPITEVEHYDVNADQWSSLAPMIATHLCSISAHYIGGSIFVVDVKGIEKYDVARNKWQRLGARTSEQLNVYRSTLIPTG